MKSNCIAFYSSGATFYVDANLYTYRLRAHIDNHVTRLTNMN